MLTVQEEDKIAKVLSELTDIEYSQLMRKVQRDKWKLIGYRWQMLKQDGKITLR